MDKQFTASEVRAKSLEIWKDDALARQMLSAFADLLEAQGKAMPVVTRESAINAIEHVGQHNGRGREAEACQMLVEGSHAVTAQPPAASVTDAMEGLRPEVQAAMRTMSGEAAGNRDDAYEVIEAELLRLADENAALLASNRDCMDWYKQLEVDFRALKARIADAPVANIQNMGDCTGGIERKYVCIESEAIIVLPSLTGRRVRLVVED